VIFTKNKEVLLQELQGKLERGEITLDALETFVDSGTALSSEQVKLREHCREVSAASDRALLL